MFVYLGGLVVLTTPFYRFPSGFLICWIINMTGINLTSIAQIVAFIIPRTKTLPEPMDSALVGKGFTTESEVSKS